MIDGPTSQVIEKEIQLKKIKRSLDNWREIVLHVNSLLLWKKRFYPWIIVSVVTLLFLEFAYYSPSFLTTVGLLLFIFTLLDYGGPTLSAVIWKQEDWNAAKERELEEICRAIASFVVQSKHFCALIMEQKVTRPYLYFAVMLSCSLFLAVIGNSISNIFIVYLLTLFLLLMPGMLHFNILQKYYKGCLLYLANILKSVHTTTCQKKIQ